MTDDDLSVKITEVDQRSKSNTHRIGKIEERQDNLDKLVASVAVMAKDQENIKSDVLEIKNDVKSLTEKPAKRWDNLVEKLIWALAAAAVGFMLAQVGL